MILKDWIKKLDDYLFDNGKTYKKFLYNFITEEEFEINDLSNYSDIYNQLIYAWYLSEKSTKKEFYKISNNFKIDFLKPENEDEEKFIEVYKNVQMAIKEIKKKLRLKYDEEFNNFIISI